MDIYKNFNLQIWFVWVPSHVDIAPSKHADGLVNKVLAVAKGGAMPDRSDNIPLAAALTAIRTRAFGD